MDEVGRTRRRVGLVATLLLGAGLGYDLAWHVVQGELQTPLLMVASVAAAAAAVVAVASHRAPGPRRDLRACLVVCVAALALLAAGGLLGAAGQALTSAMMDTDPERGLPWVELALLALGIVAIGGAWPRRSEGTPDPSGPLPD
ncbi:hypothetical protein ACHAAC_11425 [Aeromicrobium sp. CF4.19]|uniref:hypothetical protein n=1 Tax=Aeromicrobium sp. CF4.19 TaxID=3373082 RepID=UPI003EE4BC38